MRRLIKYVLYSPSVSSVPLTPVLLDDSEVESDRLTGEHVFVCVQEERK